MREILFRGKRKDNGNWVAGRLLADDVIVPKGQEFETEDIYIIADNLMGFVVIPETVGQYTGLTDKNGTKIFEGDILKGYWETVFQVVYDDCYLGFRAKEKEGMHNCIDFYGFDRIEIIGNIHDNPELLKGGEG